MPPPNPRAQESQALPSLSELMLPHQSFHMCPFWNPISELRISARAQGSQERDQETGLRLEKKPRGKADKPASHRDKAEVIGLGKRETEPEGPHRQRKRDGETEGLRKTNDTTVALGPARG